MKAESSTSPATVVWRRAVLLRYVTLADVGDEEETSSVRSRTGLGG